jgi:hypothetical protein
MSTSLTTSSGAGGDGFLPVTGFGPGSILIALIGGALTLFGSIMRRIARRPRAVAS